MLPPRVRLLDRFNGAGLISAHSPDRAELGSSWSGGGNELAVADGRAYYPEDDVPSSYGYSILSRPGGAPLLPAAAFTFTFSVATGNLSSSGYPGLYVSLTRGAFENGDWSNFGVAYQGHGQLLFIGTGVTHNVTLADNADYSGTITVSGGQRRIQFAGLDVTVSDPYPASLLTSVYLLLCPEAAGIAHIRAEV